ncbi:DUF4276 family protein [Laspinema sp. D1]|uniref:DUF4276 family protein n=1 Tax=Laspinema palackyanum TaxID=3231601 RepID=UPI0034838434|nr:DUF4276 family protein [Laspinema sp. D2b]
MLCIEVLVEEPSAEAALKSLLPKLLGSRARHKIINFGSKSKLLKVLGQRLAAYAARINKGENLRIIVLVDRDQDDCQDLKNKLEVIAVQAGLTTKSNPDAQGQFMVVNRIVIEELESWFIGDIQALRRSFSSLPSISPTSSPFRNPDNGGSWEALHRFLKKHGIYKSSYPKIEAARKIASQMNINENRSPSFQCFKAGIEALLSQENENLN